MINPCPPINVTLEQASTLPTQSQFDFLAHWVALLPLPEADSAWDGIPYGNIMKTRRARLPADQRDGQAIFMDVPNEIGAHVGFACVKPDIGAFELLSLARKLVTPQFAFEPRGIGLWASGFDQKAAERLFEALIAALLAGTAEMPQYKSKPSECSRLARIWLHGVSASHGFRRTFAEAEGNNLARYLTSLPSNELTPGIYREHISKLARETGWGMEFLDIEALAREGAGAFLAVAQGSPEPDAGIVRLDYRPPGRIREDKLALVGKGICFDTGGVNLKPAQFMLGMHKDMQGSAVALGTLLTLTRLQVDFPVECWMALATNHIGPRAYKPNDVVTAVDGTTIEVINTDAEGRMILADTLALASRSKPTLIIDYATLTGACKRALGMVYSGVFTNHRDYVPMLVEAGQDSGERVWPFPIDEDYDEALESRIADIKQCAEEGLADHILAARFLKRFVKNNIHWIHIDLSSGTHKGGLAHIPTDITGFGVRFTLNLLLDKKIM